MFRCISDSKLPIMLHTVFPEPHTGFSGFYHFKMWLHFVKLAHSADLTLCGFSTDSCSTGIAAARLLMTPSAEFIEEFGVTYLGLPHCSYKYYSVFLRPAVGRYIPPSFDWYGEIAHHIRNFREYRESEEGACLLFRARHVHRRDSRSWFVGEYAISEGTSRE